MMKVKGMDVKGAFVVITGGTDGIGAATARELHQRGAHVTIIGRSREKGAELVAQSAAVVQGGQFRFIPADLSLMANIEDVVRQLQQALPRIDLLIHCVGILIAHTEYTTEGIEKDFAVSYLSRFILTRDLVAKGLLSAGGLMLNLSASSPKIPKMARLEFGDLAVVERRVGMQSHGQAQMANDLFSMEAAQRWGLAVIGYGPGSVDTKIRRELPQWLVKIGQLFFLGSTRKPADVGQELAEIITTQTPPSGEAWFFDRTGRFVPDPFVTDQQRRFELWATSEALAAKALRAKALLI
ncbi:MAG: oxidoreductase [Roseiflexaceae bacterium]